MLSRAVDRDRITPILLADIQRIIGPLINIIRRAIPRIQFGHPARYRNLDRLLIVIKLVGANRLPTMCHDLKRFFDCTIRKNHGKLFTTGPVDLVMFTILMDNLFERLGDLSQYLITR